MLRRLSRLRGCVRPGQLPLLRTWRPAVFLRCFSAETDAKVEAEAAPIVVSNAQELSTLLTHKLLSEKDTKQLSRSLSNILRSPSSRMLDISRVATQERPAMRWISVTLYPLLNGSKTSAELFPLTVPDALRSKEMEARAALQLYHCLWETSHTRRLLMNAEPDRRDSVLAHPIEAAAVGRMVNQRYTKYNTAQAACQVTVDTLQANLRAVAESIVQNTPLFAVERLCAALKRLAEADTAALWAAPAAPAGATAEATAGAAAGEAEPLLSGAANTSTNTSTNSTSTDSTSSTSSTSIPKSPRSAPMPALRAEASALLYRALGLHTCALRPVLQNLDGSPDFKREKGKVCLWGCCRWWCFYFSVVCVCLFACLIVCVFVCVCLSFV